MRADYVSGYAECHVIQPAVQRPAKGGSFEEPKHQFDPIPLGGSRLDANTCPLSYIEPWTQPYRARHHGWAVCSTLVSDMGNP